MSHSRGDARAHRGPPRKKDRSRVAPSSVIARIAAMPASGPSRCATAIARFRATTADGAIDRSVSYSSTIASQSVSASVVADACTCGDRRLEMIGRHDVALRRLVEQCAALGDQVARSSAIDPAPRTRAARRRRRGARADAPRAVHISADSASVPVVRVAACARSSAARRIASSHSSARTGAVADRAVIALVEQQIERAMNGRQSRRDVGVGEVEETLRSRERLSCRARCASPSRRVRRETPRRSPPRRSRRGC